MPLRSFLGKVNEGDGQGGTFPHPLHIYQYLDRRAVLHFVHPYIKSKITVVNKSHLFITHVFYISLEILKVLKFKDKYKIHVL